VVIEDNMGRLGVVDNINRIFQVASADYYALADQDDLWDKDNLKLKITAAIKVKQSNKLPVIVYSDLKIVDYAGSDLNKSFMKFMRYDKSIKSLRYIPFYNMVPGCTMVFDDDFRKISLPIPKTTPMHDFWFACIAKYLAKHVYLDTPLVLYRQHENNTIGVKVDRLMRKRVVALLFGFSKYIERATSYNHNHRLILDELLSRADPSCGANHELTKISKMFDANILMRFLFVIRSGLRLDKLGYFLFGK
jgi:glycosyltransferase involved in cell wall biosynthesis